jgi:hypothetical protein
LTKLVTDLFTFLCFGGVVVGLLSILVGVPLLMSGVMIVCGLSVLVIGAVAGATGKHGSQTSS